ncbi:methyl-accepting chemotaxis protein [Azotosporobacter soli]|uniref:methyl-accepting chemotaxis protein n=1 Tax=Azotosporobacter soli TaxID=3055040 RepID=UPI0031FF11CB
MAKTRFPLRMQLMMMVSIIIVALLAVLSFGLFELNVVGKGANDIVKHTANRVMQVREAQLEFANTLNGVRGFLLYGAPAYEQEARENIQKSISVIKAYNATSTMQDTKVEGAKLEKQLTDYAALVEKIIAAKKANDPQLTTLLGEGRKLADELNQQYVKTAELQKKYLTDKGTSLFESAERMTNLAMLASLLIVLAALAYGFWYSNNMAKRLKNVCDTLEEVGHLDLRGQDRHPTRNDEIGDMANTIITMRRALKEFVAKVGNTSQILGESSRSLSVAVDQQLQAVESVADNATQIAGGASHNVENITNISSTLQQLSASSEEAAASSAQVSMGTNVAVDEAATGMELLDSVVKQNEFISEAMAEINTVTQNLASGSDKIKGIIDVIGSIAGQTNLLALNAAIEAARAGEAGRGFAVVAEEVRKLAEQSEQATKDIVEIITGMGDEITAAVNTVGKANQQVERGKNAAASSKQGFSAIVDKLQDVKNGIEQIAGTVDEMAKGSQLMVGNVENINAVAEETSANCQMVAASAEEQSARMHEISNNAERLQQMAGDLKSVVEQFKI